MEEKEILFQSTIPLCPVTKKNSQRIMLNKRTGARWIAQSPAYKRYAKNARPFLQRKEPIHEPCNIKMTFYMNTNRRVDLSNLQSACLDVLVDNLIIADDNCKIVVSHDGSRVYLDKENPRTEIEITKVRE